MTEDEWRSSTDPWAMCDFIRTATTSWKTRWLGWMKAKRFQVSDRKWRLIELARLEKVAREGSFPQLDELLPSARLRAEGRLPPGEANWVASAISSWLWQVNRRVPRLPPEGEYRACAAVAALGWMFLPQLPMDLPHEEMVRDAEARARRLLDGNAMAPRRQALNADLADAVRDILGHLFVADPIDPAWLAANDGAARGLAVSMAASGDYRDMPVLADALEDAGCATEAVLSHCRQTTRHVRGCWVVDRLLGRE
ncbi:MAG: hypothetical protein U0797_17410 [Gemmataceae bacterium]